MALEFDGGSSQKIDLANTADFSPGTGILTFACRFKTSHNFSGALGVLFGDYGADQGNLIYLGIQTDNKLDLFLRDAGFDLLRIFGQGGVVNDGVVHTAVGVRETQTTSRLYLDGSSIGTDSNASVGTITTSDGATPTISCLNPIGGAFLFYYGEIIEFRFYKGKAFSAAEAKIFHEVQGADNIVDNLVARWLMNEKPDGTAAAGANTVIDISGNGNHGSPVNSPVYRAEPMRLVRPLVTKTIFA